MKKETTNLLKFRFLYIILLSSISAFAQDYFSGKISYQVKYQNPENNENSSHLAEENQIDSIVYYIHEGNYKSETFYKGQLTEGYVYNKESKWVHYHFPDKTYYLSIDVKTEKMNQPLRFKWLGEEKTILNELCLKAEVKQGYQKEEIYYADQIKVDPEGFSQHLYAHWYKTLQLTGGRLPLKNIYYDPNFTEIKEAIQVKEIEFEANFFEPDPDLTQIVFREILDQEAVLKELNPDTEACYDKLANQIESGLIIGKNDNYVMQVVVDENGKPIKANAIGGSNEFSKIAERIILECGFEFEPAIYQGQKVKSELYIPIQL